MKVSALHIGVRSLAGHTRLFLSVCDWMKSQGWKVTIYDRFRAPMTQIINGNRVTQQLSGDQMHYDIKRVTDYFPLDYLTWRDIRFEDIPAFHGPFGFPKMPEEIMQELDNSDLIFSDSELYVTLPTMIRHEFWRDGIHNIDYAYRWAPKFIQYVHFPSISGPNANKDYQPARILCNSEFTHNAIVEKWKWTGARVVYPPENCEHFDSDVPMKERKYDIVIYARLAKDKFTQFSELRARLPDKKFIVVGSNYGMADDLKRQGVDVVSNATFDDITEILVNSKMYIHFKGIDPGVKNEGEHFGQSVMDAAAAGCLPFVPATPSGTHEIPGTIIYSDIRDLASKIERADPEMDRETRADRIRRKFDVHERSDELKEAFSL